MADTKKISKLGTSASEIRLVDDCFIKTHKANNIFELNELERGIKIISKKLPETIASPKLIELKQEADNKGQFLFRYHQDKLHPWIKAEWITGQQLYQVGETILEQQKVLFEENLCLVDARPQNYWLVKTKGVLVDLGSIKPLNRQNLLSFETDFKKNFVTPLILEIELDLPISLYFKGQIQSSNINLWGLNRNFRSITSIKDLFKSFFIDYISNIISSSSPDFIEFLNFESTTKKDNNIKNQKSKFFLRNIEKKFKKLIPSKINRSNWNKYEEFHDKEYTNKKLKEIMNFADSKKDFTNIVDLGSNITTKDIKNIKIRIDNDLITCRKMRQTYDDKQIILQIDVADFLCHFETNKDNPLNFSGEAKAAVIAGLIHHLIIDCGLNINLFYERIAGLYDYVLLEFPAAEDPMVKLLIRKKNEIVPWDWENDHLPLCSKYFNIINQEDLSNTRKIFQLQNKRCKPNV